MRSLKLWYLVILGFLIAGVAPDLKADCPGRVFYFSMQCECGQTIHVSACQSCSGGNCPNCTPCGSFLFCCGGTEAGCLASPSCFPGGSPVAVQVRSADGSRTIAQVAECNAIQGGVSRGNSGKK
jgi:hypothetical protein